MGLCKDTAAIDFYADGEFSATSPCDAGDARAPDDRVPRAARVNFVMTGYKLFVAANHKVRSSLPPEVWRVSPMDARMWHAKADLLRVMNYIGALRDVDITWAESIPGWTWNVELTAFYVNSTREKYWSGTISTQEVLVANSIPNWRW